MATHIGIDLGSYIVKIAVLEQRLRKPPVWDYRVRALPQEDGPPGREERLAALAELLGELRIEENTSFAVSVASDRVSVRSVELPFTDKDRIQKTLAFELEGFVPFDLDEMVLDYRVRPLETGGSRVLCGMCPRNDLAGLLASLSTVKVDPRTLVLDADVLGALADDGDRVQAVVDIGHRRTLVSVVQDGEVLGMRAISMGGRELTQALVTDLGISVQDAEGQKHIAQLAGGVTVAMAEEWGDEHTDPMMAATPTSPNLAAPGSVADVLQRALRPLISSLRLTLIALEDELEVGVDEVLVAGGTANLGGLPALLSQDLGVPVRRHLVSDEAQALGDGSRFALAHALAERGAGMSGGRELHFRQGEFDYKGDMDAIRTLVTVAAVAMAFFFIVGTAMFGVRFWQYQQEIDKLHQQIADTVMETFPEVTAEDIKTSDLARGEMVIRTEATLERVRALGATVGGDPPVLTTLKEISTGMPKHGTATGQVVVNVKELTISEEAISMKADTSGYEAAATIEQAMQRIDGFEAAKKGDEKKVRDGISFSVTIPLDVEESEEEEG